METFILLPVSQIWQIGDGRTGKMRKHITGMSNRK
jgi:hypothetical protein